MIDLFYSTNRVNVRDKPIFLSIAYSLPIRGINVENDSNQALLDLNDKYYHEYYVPMMSLKLFYPKKKYIGFNVLKDHKKKLKGFNKSNQC